MYQWQGNPIELVRNGQKGDEGFNIEKAQVQVRLSSGTLKIIDRSELTKTVEQ